MVITTDSSQARSIVVYLSSDPFTRDALQYKAAIREKDAYVLVADYDRSIIQSIAHLAPTRIVLHNPRRIFVRLVEVAKRSGLLPSAKVEIHPGVMEYHDAAIDWNIVVTGLGSRERSIIGAHFQGERPVETARRLGITSSNVRAIRSRLGPEIRALASLRDRMTKQRALR